MSRGRGQGDSGSVSYRQQLGGIMKIALPDKNQEFWIREHEDYPGLKLIIPSKTKQVWAEDELHLRSVIINEDNEIVSTGFAKFRNLGEKPEEVTKFEQHLVHGKPIMFTEKMDGSLLIRSVYGNEVMWRTRGTFNGGDMRRAINEVVDKYPALKDPSVRQNSSMIFEFIHPEHPIVVNYNGMRDMILLGEVEHKDLRLHTMKELENTAKELDLNLVQIHELPTDLQGLAEKVHEYDNCEGVVARFDDEQHYIKMKSAQYLAQHSLRFNFGKRRCMELIMLERFTSEDAFKEHLYGLGMDAEIAGLRAPYYRVYETALNQTQKTVDTAQEFVGRELAHLGGVNGGGELGREEKKAFAMKVQKLSDRPLQNMCFALANGHKAEAAKENLLKANIEEGLRSMGLDTEDEE